MKILLLPTWVLIRLMTPILPKSHLWKNKKFTLTDWSNGATDFTYSISIILWINFLTLLFVLFYMI
jgi:hypothetical protein